MVDDARAAERVGEDGGGDCCSGGRGKKKESGLRRSLERNGGLRTFKYILNVRSALFACGTYLSVIGQIAKQIVDGKELTG